MTERKRATGFALMDAAFAADPKFLRLRGRAADPAVFAAAVGVFWLLLADARRAKSPVLAWEDYEEFAEQITLLKSASLLSEHGFAVEAFDRWAPAYRSVTERTSGTNGYERVRKDTKSTLTSGQVNSGQFSSRPSVPGDWEIYETTDGAYAMAQIKEGVPFHDGTHGDCKVCVPMQEARRSR